MIRDTQDERTVAKFVQDVCIQHDWKLKFQVTTSEDVQNDPDAEPDERFTFEGFAEYFEETMLSRDAKVAAILDERIMSIADDIRVDYNAKVLEIDIFY